MVDIREYNRQKKELTEVGYSFTYVDDWAPKITLYRHKPSYNQDGVIVADVGTSLARIPGEPSYVLKKAKIGLFPWKPNEGCTCRWCSEREAEGAAKFELAQVAEAAPEPSGTGKGIMGPHFKS